VIISIVKFPSSYIEVQGSQALLGPSSTHWLGTDSLGRDYFWRLILGLRTSFFIALVSSMISFFIGVVLGSISADASRVKSQWLNRIFDVVDGIPSFILLAVIMQFYISLGATATVFALSVYCGLFHWPQLARLTRVQIEKTKVENFVEAAVSLGGSRVHIFRQHLWPSVYGIWLTWFCFHVPGEIMFESTLSFLGFGIQPPQTSLGLLIWEGWKYLDDKPIFLFAPAVLSFLVVLGFRSLLRGRVPGEVRTRAAEGSLNKVLQLLKRVKRFF
jgi:oligopeptide transport system permease protein